MSLHSRITKLAEIELLTKEQGLELDGLHNLVYEMDMGRLIECLDDGFVRLVEAMGSDAAICQAARVSYGAGTKSVNDDRGLIRYLMRHDHTTPFEMVTLKFHIRIPMDAWRQQIRHRTASVNEYSTRYSEAIDSAQVADCWRLQAKNNKQGSAGELMEWPDGYKCKPLNDYPVTHVVVREEDDQAMMLTDSQSPGRYLSARERHFHEFARELYEERLKFGVAREQARKDLPLSTYTEAYWQINLHNLFHYLRLRMDSHAQLEIRTYANAIAQLAKRVCPEAWAAFEDYKVNGMNLTGPEIAYIRMLNNAESGLSNRLSKRELAELHDKLDRVGLCGNKTVDSYFIAT